MILLLKVHLHVKCLPSVRESHLEEFPKRQYYEQQKSDPEEISGCLVVFWRLVRVHVDLQHIGGHHPHEEEVEGKVEEEEPTDLAPFHPQKRCDCRMGHEMAVFWDLGHVPQRFCLWQLLSYYGISNLQITSVQGFQKIVTWFFSRGSFPSVFILGGPRK